MAEQLDTLFQWFMEALRLRPVLMLFIILGLGYLIGNIRIAGFSLGPVAGVLFAGIFFDDLDIPRGFDILVLYVTQSGVPLPHSYKLQLFKGDIITVIPICVVYVFGRRVLKLNPAILMGALTGAMTSGASLSVVTTEAKSPVPAIGYAATYAFGK